MRLTVITFLLAFAFEASAQSGLRLKHFNLDDGLAIQGYDPVAYFIQGKAIEGSKKYSASYEGVTYYFTSESDKAAFLNNPSKYEPQFGGWCAYAMGANGDKVEIDPETFKIINGKLYLFYHSWINNTLLKWNDDELNLKSKAEKNWQKTFN